MPQAASAKRNSSQRAKALLHERLRGRQREIEEEVLARIHSDGAPTVAADPDYADGLRRAVPAAVDYCLVGTERGEGRTRPIPAALLVQARVAARNRISLDTVLRRYFAGYTLLGDFMVEEAEAAGVASADLKLLLRALAASFDRLLAGVSEEHGREAKETVWISSEHRRTRLVERLLAGEPLDAAELEYDFSGHHLGAIAKGADAVAAFRRLRDILGRPLLVVERPEDDTVWAWIGGHQPFGDLDDLAAGISRSWPGRIRMALGEEAQGAPGWRLTHRQARAALPIALRRDRGLTRYGDVAMLASIIQDDLLKASLSQLYLKPLEDAGGDVIALCETLQAYFAADRHVSSAAAALGVSRQTVANRLRTAEARLRRPLGTCSVALQSALEIREWLASPRVNRR